MGKIECQFCHRQQDCQTGCGQVSVDECLLGHISRKEMLQDTFVKKVALIGLPNTGKSQLFNKLTGEYAVVANYPRTTIEIKRTLTKMKGQPFEIIDTPSLHSFYINSEEEILVRNLILEERPDIIVQCIDAVHDKQSFMLTADLLELEIPLVVVLNNIDESRARGTVIDSKKLSQILGVTVIESIATHGAGREELKNAIFTAKKSCARINYGFKIENALVDVMAVLPFDMAFKFKIALLLSLLDPFLEDSLEKKHGVQMVNRARIEISKVRRQLKGKMIHDIYNKRHQWVEEICAKVVKKENRANKISFLSNFSQACRHPVGGVAILLGIVAAICLGVCNVTKLTDPLLNSYFVHPTIGFIASLKLPLFWNDYLVGEHGIMTLGIFNAFCTVLPILLVFFFAYGLLEDSGYISNFNVLTKNMAIPPSAQLGMNLAILGRFGAFAMLIAFGTLGLLEASLGALFNLFIKPAKKNYLIQELPRMRIPSFRLVGIKTYYRTRWFFKDALPVFLLAAVGIFAIEKSGLLALIRLWLHPLLAGVLGLPAQMTDVLFLGFARREIASGVIYKMADNGTLNYIQAIVAVVIVTMIYSCFAKAVVLNKEKGIKTAVIMSVLFLAISFFLTGLLNWALVLAAR